MIVNVSFKLRSWEQEAEMIRTFNRIAGRGRSGSGFCIGNGERDLDYSVRDGAKAKKFLRAAKRIKGVKAEIYQ